MKTQGTKSRKLRVKLIDGKGNIYSKIFKIELPAEFDQKGFQIDGVEIAKEFVKPYPNALAKLVSNLITAQVNDLEKIKILAGSTLDPKSKTRFVSDHNLVTANRITTIRNLYPKVKAYRTEKGLDEISIERFLRDFLPKDDSGDKWSPFQYVTIEKDADAKFQTPEIREKLNEIAEVAVSEPEATTEATTEATVASE